MKLMTMTIQLVIVLTLISSCNGGKEGRLDCIEKLVSLNKEDQDYEKIKLAIAHNIEIWAAEGLQGTKSYLPQNSQWQIDEFFFNENKTKIFGWILKIDSEIPNDLSPLEEGKDILDFVEYFSGEKRHGQWFFYIHHMPKIFFSRKSNNDNLPHTFDYLSKKAKIKAIEGGLLKWGKCNLNYKFINSWTDREGRDLFNWHQKFLLSRDI